MGVLTWVAPMPTLVWLSDRKGDRLDETHVSAEPSSAREDARVPGANEDTGGSKGTEAAPRERTQTADGLSGRFPRGERLTRAADFQAIFQRGKRVDRPSFIILWRDGAEVRKVGFAVSRGVRRAVERNRTKRRLREAYRATRAQAPQGVSIVIVGRPAAMTAEFGALKRHMADALRAIPGPGRAA
jgi:ribonuclease P protein component